MTHTSSATERLAAALLLIVAALLLGAPTVRAQAANPPAANAAVDSAPPPAPPVRRSWITDRRAFAVGDVITVLIDDYTISTAVKDNVASDTRSRNLGITFRLPSSGSKSGGLDGRNDANTQQRGALRRENRFQNEMSVRVVSTGANGLMQLRGTKDITVDKALQSIVLEGWVRAQDVSSQNTVESFRVADATLTYTSPGPLGKTKSGLLSKILGLFFP